MELIGSSVSTVIGNLIVFSFLPLLWWFFRHRKEGGFFRWTGLYPPKLQCKWWWVAVFAVLYVLLYAFDGEFLLSQKTIEALNAGSDAIQGNDLVGRGMAAVLPAFLLTFIGNGVAEEILFRGFLCKRFCEKLGRKKGIFVQAFLFGGMHFGLVALSGLPVGFDFYLYEFGYTFLGALLLGIANERLFNGSIVPSILLHGTGNFIGQLAAIFQWW